MFAAKQLRFSPPEADFAAAAAAAYRLVTVRVNYLTHGAQTQTDFHKYMGPNDKSQVYIHPNYLPVGASTRTDNHCRWNSFTCVQIHRRSITVSDDLKKLLLLLVPAAPH